MELSGGRRRSALGSAVLEKLLQVGALAVRHAAEVEPAAAAGLATTGATAGATAGARARPLAEMLATMRTIDAPPPTQDTEAQADIVLPSAGGRHAPHRARHRARHHLPPQPGGIGGG